MSTLCILECAYRGTLEEQDDTILWLVRALRGAGAQVSLLLRGNAVNYLTRGHDCSRLEIGGQKLGNPPVLDADVCAAAAQGVPVYVVREDLADRGLSPSGFASGIIAVSRADVAELFERHARIWHW
jgi:hypothetical protein